MKPGTRTGSGRSPSPSAPVKFPAAVLRINTLICRTASSAARAGKGSSHEFSPVEPRASLHALYLLYLGAAGRIINAAYGQLFLPELRKIVRGSRGSPARRDHYLPELQNSHIVHSHSCAGARGKKSGSRAAAHRATGKIHHRKSF